MTKKVDFVSTEITGLKNCFAIALFSPWVGVYFDSVECAHSVYVHVHNVDKAVYVTAKNGNLTGKELSRVIFEKSYLINRRRIP
jgi:hypothetical protein